MKEDKITIAIDGHSGCGKSSTAKVVSGILGYIYIDTGAMYRASTLYFLENDINFHNKENLEKALDQIVITFSYNNASQQSDTHLNGRNVEEKIRTLEVSEKVSEVSAISLVRKKMVSLQREMGKNKGVVMDGRDIGTVVFPDADLKIFMTADLKVRAERRMLELKQKNQKASLEEVVSNLKKRDEIDSNRSDSPLVQADDAILLDTSNLTFDEQVDFIVNLAKEKISAYS